MTNNRETWRNHLILTYLSIKKQTKKSLFTHILNLKTLNQLNNYFLIIENKVRWIVVLYSGRDVFKKKSFQSILQFDRYYIVENGEIIKVIKN